MTLTLTLANVDSLENGETTKLVLDRHGALIGRSPNADWSLPDAKKHVSFTHCEIIYRGGEYLLLDKSTNGTFLNGARERLTEPHVLASGDEFTVGHYRVLVRVASVGGAVEPAPKPKATGDWAWPDAPAAPQAAPGGWDDLPADKPQSAWPAEPPGAAISGRGAMSENWSPPRAEPPPPSPPDDVWGRYDRANQVNWDSGGFSTPQAAAPAAAPAPLAAPPPPTAPVSQHSAQPVTWTMPKRKTSAQTSAVPPPPVSQQSVQPVTWTPPQRQTPPLAPPPPVPDQALPRAPAPGADDAWNALLRAAGLTPADLRAAPRQTGAAAGSILHRLVGGLVLMLEARARAKAELGITSTMVEINGNNPLKFLRHPEAALARLLNPPERGYMDADRAVEDAFKDLQAHQMASLAAMQGALRATLARFAPSAIRGRAEAGGLLAKILPGAGEAALWQAYEREFEGVVKGSDEAFMDFFAKAFREAYVKASAEMRR